MPKEKTLIIKLGYSETLVPEISRTTSLGDVLRSTVLLSLFSRTNVTWLVDAQAIPLLKGNPHIQRIMPYDMTSVLQLRAERFDAIVNLEKVAGVCAFADSLASNRRFGFRYDPDSGSVMAYDGSQHIIELCSNPVDKAVNTRCWEELLFEMVGGKWRGEVPLLGYGPKSRLQHDIGLNHHVGAKWPIKAWPAGHWQRLVKIIGNRRSVSWQEGLNSLEEYFEWINSCSLIVTNDSLGLHIAHALGKKIVALFGPTPANEIYVKNGVKLLPQTSPECMPCMSTVCKRGRTCMHDIGPEQVAAAIDGLMEGN
ncbi:MAG: glycosyltransferase family 9 protein [Deltaproteobacteria bacterium]